MFDLREVNGVGYFAAWEVRPGAFAEDRVKYLLGKMAQKVRIDRKAV